MLIKYTIDLKEIKDRDYLKQPVYVYNLHHLLGDQAILLQWHPETELICAMQASGTLEVDGVKYPLETGMIAAVNRNQLHSFTCESDANVWLLVIVFQTEDLRSEEFNIGQQEILLPLATGATWFKPFIHQHETGYSEIFETMIRISSLFPMGGPLDPEPWKYVMGKSLLLELTAHYAKAGGLVDACESKILADVPIRHLIAYLQDHFQEHITLSDMATHLHLNPSYLIRIFKRYTGVTPIVFLNHVRLAHAATLLKRRNMTVEEAAYACGFENPSYFSRLFHRQFGKSPRDFSRFRQETPYIGEKKQAVQA